MSSICGNSFKTVGKAFQVKLVERLPKVYKADIKATGEESLKNLKSKIYLDLFSTFWLLNYSNVLFHSFDVFTIILQCIK